MKDICERNYFASAFAKIVFVSIIYTGLETFFLLLQRCISFYHFQSPSVCLLLSRFKKGEIYCNDSWEYRCQENCSAVTQRNIHEHVYSGHTIQYFIRILILFISFYFRSETLEQKHKSVWVLCEVHFFHSIITRLILSISMNYE